jgi:predicted nuclease of predicted toxin-antitoxin system
MGEIPPDPGDEAVLGIAFDEGRVLITLDKDFGELAIVYGKPHCRIIRLVDLPAVSKGPIAPSYWIGSRTSCLVVPS